ncbi:hypothetical protein, partial [Methylobacterium sp. E-066]|uniref:hypothetical protein n=2 Tax=unclassified Methylobacterium TaxID=2615210 RepID=UPI001FBBBF32
STGPSGPGSVRRRGRCGDGIADGIVMKGLLLNALLGVGLGRFGSVWGLPVFLPVVAAELAYGFQIHHLSLSGGLRRGVALLICGQLGFLLGALLRPLPGEG